MQYGFFYSAEHGSEDGAFVAETDFGFGRMYVDIDFLRFQFQKKDNLRIFARQEAALIGFAYRTYEQFVIDGSPVDIQQNAIRTRLALSGRRGKTKGPDAMTVRSKGSRLSVT